MPPLAPYLFELLHEHGVEHAFGIPGDFALTLFDALSESKIAPIGMTHEPCVGFAADAYARVRGLGLAVVTYSVGGLNMVNAVAGAYAERAPVVVLSGGPGVRERRERNLLHHKVKTFDTQRRVYEEVTCYAALLDDPAVAYSQIRRAVDHALTFKRPVYLEIPRDLILTDVPVSAREDPPVKRTDDHALAEAVQESVELLQRAELPVVIACVDVHRFGLQSEVVALVERMGVPVCSTMSGKSVFPERHPQYIGIYNGEAGDPQVRELVEGSDCVVMLGVVMSDINMGMFTAKLDPGRTIYATSDRIAIKHHQYEDVRFEDFVCELAAREDLPTHNPAGIEAMKPRVSAGTGAITMNSLLFELNHFIDENTVLVSDVGDAMFAADDIQTRHGASYFCPAFYASMGFAVPGVVGAQIADRSRHCIALLGDGAFQMTGMELVTAKRLGLNPTVIVLNNGSYASLRAMGHEHASFVRVPPLDYAAIGKVLGGHGVVIETTEQLRKALPAARGRSVFTILDIRIPPDDYSPALHRLGELFRRTLKG